MRDRRIEACILDGADASFAGESLPLHGLKNIFITPRLGSHTLEARLRSSWYVAHRMHEAISNLEGTSGFGQLARSAPMDLELPGAVSPSEWGEPASLMR